VSQQSFFLISQRTADALAREARLRSILDTVPDALIVIDEWGVIKHSAGGRAISSRSETEQRVERIKTLTEGEELGSNLL